MPTPGLAAAAVLLPCRLSPAAASSLADPSGAILPVRLQQLRGALVGGRGRALKVRYAVVEVIRAI